MSIARHISPSVTIAFPERSTFILPALTVWASAAICLGSRKSSLGIVSLLTQLDSKSLVVIVGLTVVGVFSVFILGHILELLSQLISERILADKLDGFPHERVIPIEFTTGRYRRFVRRKRTNLRFPTFFFEGAKLLVSSIVFIVLIKIVERYPSFRESTALRALFGIFLDYGYVALGIALFFAIPAVLIRYAPILSGPQRRTVAARLLLRSRRLHRSRRSVRVVATVFFCASVVCVGPLVFLYDVADRLVRGVFRLNKEIDPQTFHSFRDVFRRNVGFEWTSIQNNDRFCMPYLLLQLRKPDLLKSIQSTRAASTFCRNQSLACMISAALLAGAYRIDQVDMPGILTKSDMIQLSLVAFTIGWIFHWRFLQQYYMFTKMTFRAVATLDSKQTVRSGKQIGATH